MDYWIILLLFFIIRNNLYYKFPGCRSRLRLYQRISRHLSTRGLINHSLSLYGDIYKWSFHLFFCIAISVIGTIANYCFMFLFCMQSSISENSIVSEFQTIRLQKLLNSLSICECRLHTARMCIHVVDCRLRCLLQE